MDTDLAAVPAETVSEVGCGGALLVHQQQTGKQSLQLQGDHSDLQRRKNLLTCHKDRRYIYGYNLQYRNLLWPLASLCLPGILILLAPN